MNASALSAGVTARAGGLYTDNLTLEEDDKTEQWVGVGAVGLWVDHDSPAIEADAVGELEYRDYGDDRFEDETLFSMDAVAEASLIPESLVWWFEDYFRQAAVDPLQPPTPDNRQDANLFSTGPEATWRLAPVHSLVAGARYSQYYFSETVLDSIRPAAYGEWLYDWSPRTDITVNISAMGVDYANQRVNENYRRGDASVLMETDLARGRFEVEGGSTRIDREESEDITGYLARLLWEYELTSTSGVTLYGLSQYTDVGENIRMTAERGGADSLLNEQLIGDIYQVTEADLSYERNSGVAGVEVSARWSEEDYENEPLDRDRQRALGEFRYGLSRLTVAGVRAWYREDDYTILDRVDSDSFVALILDRRLSRSLYFNVELSRRERDSTAPGASFTENRGYLMLRYQPETIGTRFTAPQRYE